MLGDSSPLDSQRLKVMVGGQYSKTMTVTVTKLSVNGRSVGNAVSRTVGRTVLDIGAGRLALKQRICRYEPGRRITDSRSEHTGLLEGSDLQLDSGKGHSLTTGRRRTVPLANLTSATRVMASVPG